MLLAVVVRHFASLSQYYLLSLAKEVSKGTVFWLA